jgi:hypothetical protein
MANIGISQTSPTPSLRLSPSPCAILIRKLSFLLCLALFRSSPLLQLRPLPHLLVETLRSHLRQPHLLHLLNLPWLYHQLARLHLRLRHHLLVLLYSQKLHPQLQLALPLSPRRPSRTLFPTAQLALSCRRAVLQRLVRAPRPQPPQPLVCLRQHPTLVATSTVTKPPLWQE